MKILIIGGFGYVGSKLSRHLADRGFHVSAFGSRTNDYALLTEEDLKDYTDIILLAGHSSVQMCIGGLKSPWTNNVTNFHNLIKKINPTARLIYASSASVYGNANDKIYTEEDFSTAYINNYDLSKVSLDLLANYYATRGRTVVGLRFGTVNGGSPVIRRDLMINSMVYSAIKNKTVIVTNKHVNRPILALDDLCRAIETILVNEPVSDVYNLSSFNSTVNDISKHVSKITGVSIDDHGDTAGVYNFAIDNSKFKTKFNFNFEETLESTVANVVKCYTEENPIIVTRNEYFNYI